jgi:hypothetical protein
MKLVIRSFVHLVLVGLGIQAFAQGTAFTYQGQLVTNSSPVTGIYDLRFTLYDSTNLPGTVVAGPLTNSATPVNNGLFTTVIDFGIGVFTGPARFLEIAVQSNGTTGFTVLTPRQQLAPTPYAITAENLNGLQIQPNPSSGAPNFIGGSSANYMAPGTIGAVIAGGGAVNYSGLAATDSNSVSGNFSFIGSGLNNQAQEIYDVIGGGYNNSISLGADSAFIGGGGGNQINGNDYKAVIAGGNNNYIGPNSAYSVIGGGSGNIMESFTGQGVIGGGSANAIRAGSIYGAIPGGQNNQVAGSCGFAAGQSAQANHNGTFVWADDSSATAFASTSSNQFLIRATGGVGINTDSPAGMALNVNGAVMASNFVGSGAGLSSLNAASLTGPVPGASLTAVPAASLTGTVANSQLANSSVTINAGSGLSGGGSVALGGTVTLASTITAGTGVPWQTVAGTNQQAAGNNGYIADNTTQVTVTLPASPNLGDIVRVAGQGAGGWQLVAANTNQSILGASGQSEPGTWTSNSVPVEYWTSVASSSDGTKLIAVVNGGGIWTSTNSGNTWSSQNNAPTEAWYSVASSGDGTKLFAVANPTNSYSAAIYASTDSGVTWTITTAPPEYWESVASSSDGTRPYAAVAGGGIFTNSLGTWYESSAPSESWKSVASSSDGTNLVAVVNAGGIWTSTDAGDSWSSHNNAPTATWSSVASSSNGTKLVAVVDDGGIWTSTDSGNTWSSQNNAPSAEWVSVASSSDGNELVAVGAGIWTSTDAGITWSLQTNAPMENWISIASSSDGTKLVAAVYGGGIYTYGPTSGPPAIAGGQGDAVEVVYAGNDQFVPVSSYDTNIADSSLSANVALRAGGNAFTGNQTVTSGNVGIGTTSPTETLDVSGGIRATGGSSAASGTGVEIDYNGANDSAGRIFTCDRSTGAYFDLGLGNYTHNNGIMVKSSGNIGIGTVSPAYKLDVQGDINARGNVRANGVALTSDRNAKENFAPVDARQVLAKVACIPMTEWNYKTDSPDVRHLGPMAQDFRAAFGLDGADDRHISVIDEGGVALTAIQGLNQKLDDKDAEIQTLKQQNESLEKRLDNLQQIVQALAAKK